MPTLSAFLDESGDTGTQSDYYLLTLVFHEQDVDIAAPLARLSSELSNLGFPEGMGLHCGPMVRGEEVYHGMPLQLRRRLFFKLFSFARVSGISYKTFVVKKRECPDKLALRGRLSKELGAFLRDNLEYLQRFNPVIVYYDNGQSMVTDLINSIFNAYLFDVEVRKVKPDEYRLFQVADMLCTLELAKAKLDDGRALSKSEEHFFESRRRLMKVYLKTLERLHYRQL